MISKTIKYVDYNNIEREETFYFNLTKAEVMEMELGTTGGLAEKIQRIISAQNVPEIIKTFKELLLKSYGIKSDDGRRFIKSEQISTEFSQTEAYSILYMELATDTNAGSAFVNGIMPKDFANTVGNYQNQNSQYQSTNYNNPQQIPKDNHSLNQIINDRTNV